MQKVLNLGIMGCAGVAEYALLQPARDVPGIHIAAVASRDPARGQTFAERHGIASALSYEGLLESRDIDALYIPLPNAMHYEWSRRAIAAGKAVLCEKPLVSNWHEAQALIDFARAQNIVLMEAMHWRYHPLAARMMAILAAGEIGAVQAVDVTFLIPAQMVAPDNIRFDYRLGGGVTMDAGAYCVNFIRMVLGEPVAVTSATAQIGPAEVDVAMRAQMCHANGALSSIHCSHVHPEAEFRVNARITGAAGSMVVHMPFMPHLGNALEITSGSQTRQEAMPLTSSYHYQLLEFLNITIGEKPPTVPLEDAVRNMAVIDSIYEAAGMRIRGMN